MISIVKPPFDASGLNQPASVGSIDPDVADWLGEVHLRLPAEFDPACYRGLNSIAERLPDDQLFGHYSETGRPNGWRANSLATREDALALIAGAPSLLDIGGNSGVPDIATTVTLQVGDPISMLGGRRFAAAVSSHQIQTVPDFVQHLNDVGNALLPGGLYLLFLPDKRYCLDHFMPITTIGGILEAAIDRRRASGWRSQIDSLTMNAHNDSLRHWSGDHGVPRDLTPKSLRHSLTFADDPGASTTPHIRRNWFFTPESFRSLARLVYDLALTDLRPIRVYSTLRNMSEFWVVLERLPGERTGPKRGSPDVWDIDSDSDPGMFVTVRRKMTPEELAPIGPAILSTDESEEDIETRLAFMEAGVAAHAVVVQQARNNPPPALRRPVPGMKRLLISFLRRGPSRCLLGVATADPLYFQPLPLPAEIVESHAEASGLAADDRYVYAALSGNHGETLLVLNREDLSFNGLHLLRSGEDSHSIAVRDNWLYLVSTGTDEVIRYPLIDGVPGGPEFFWRPDDLGRRMDLHHFNGIWPVEDGFLISGMDQRGIFFNKRRRKSAPGFIQKIPSGEMVLDGLWFPHSVMIHNDRLVYVQSGISTVNIAGRGVIRQIPGWVRGVCMVDDWLMVGSSAGRRGDGTGRYAPFSICGISRCSFDDLTVDGMLDLSYWGNEIYEMLTLDT